MTSRKGEAKTGTIPFDDESFKTTERLYADPGKELKWFPIIFGEGGEVPVQPWGGKVNKKLRTRLGRQGRCQNQGGLTNRNRKENSTWSDVRIREGPLHQEKELAKRVKNRESNTYQGILRHCISEERKGGEINDNKAILFKEIIRVGPPKPNGRQRPTAKTDGRGIEI